MVKVPLTRIVSGRLGSLFLSALTSCSPVVTVTRVDRSPKPPVVPPLRLANPCGLLAQALKAPQIGFP